MVETLEDSWTDILKKALLGVKNRDCPLAPERLQALLEGKKNDADLRLLAKALSLQPDRLLTISRGEYYPQVGQVPEGLRRFQTDFGGMWVNSYVAWDPNTHRAIAFDTGADASELLEFLRQHNLQLDLLLLTHSHGDHVFEMDRIREKTSASAWIAENLSGAHLFTPGKTFSAGALKVETRLTNGHSPAGITYVIYGLSRCVAVVGDALFAGSMGKANVSYQEALHTCASEILSLPEDTLLCPGHGPLTTVAQEKSFNPFFGDSV